MVIGAAIGLLGSLGMIFGIFFGICTGAVIGSGGAALLGAPHKSSLLAGLAGGAAFAVLAYLVADFPPFTRAGAMLGGGAGALALPLMVWLGHKTGSLDEFYQGKTAMAERSLKRAPSALADDASARKWLGAFVVVAAGAVIGAVAGFLGGSLGTLLGSVAGGYAGGMIGSRIAAHLGTRRSVLFLAWLAGVAAFAALGYFIAGLAPFTLMGALHGGAGGALMGALMAWLVYTYNGWDFEGYNNGN